MCLKRMGQVVRSNMAMMIEVALELIIRLELAAKQAKDWDRMLLLMTAAAVVIGFGGSLRGHEIFFADLFGMRKHLSKGKRATPAVGSHLLVALLGQFKGETGERYHLTPLASKTASGMEIWREVTRLIVAWDMRGVRQGPLFQDGNGGVIKMATLDAVMHKYLINVQAEDLSLIPADVDIVEKFSLHQSLQRGSTMQARNKNVAEADIVTANRWRNVERAGGRRPGRSMM